MVKILQNTQHSFSKDSRHTNYFLRLLPAQFMQGYVQTDFHQQSLQWYISGISAYYFSMLHRHLKKHTPINKAPAV